MVAQVIPSEAGGFVMRPLGSFVLLRPDHPAMQSGRLVLPEAHVGQPVSGTVIAIGPLALAVQPGMRAWHQKYAGEDYEIDGVRHLILPEDEILGVEVVAGT